MAVGRLSTGAGLSSGLLAVPVTPASVSVGSGSATVSGNGQISFSSVSSVTVNNCFSSTYTNYRIDVNINSSSGGFDPLFSLQSSASLHYWRKSQNETVTTGSNLSSWNFMRQAAGGAACVIDIMSPNLNTTTFGLSRFADNDLFFGYSSLTRTSSVETGFSITFQGATGTLRVYGYANGA